MSLRTRLLAAIALSLLLSFGIGAALAVWLAARSVGIELAAALDSAQGSASAALSATVAPVDEAELRRIVGAFDGNRHVRATLLDGNGAVLLVSHPLRASKPPGWFQAAVSPALPPRSLPAGPATLRLAPDSTNEAAERWSELREAGLLLAMFGLLSSLFCSLATARAMRALTDLVRGLARLRRGESDVRVNAAGPPEIATLAAAFNALSGSLQATRTHNQQLQMQAAMLVEEERTQIAHDLHDEVGPLLFAITAFTAAISRQVAEGDLAAIPPQLRAIQDAASAIQTEVRDMLGRLHDVAPQPACLDDSLAGLIAFWRRVRPETAFSLQSACDDAELPAPVREALFRVAQEGMSNAVRHGNPGSVALRLWQDGGGVALSVADDGAGGPEEAGYGLPGMRARVAALGGSLRIARLPGWTVTVTLPATATQAAEPATP